MQRTCTSIKHKLTNGFSKQMNITKLNDSQIKVTINTIDDSIFCIISKINNPLYRKGSLLLSDAGSSLLNTNKTDDLSNYLTVCNFQLNYRADYLPSKELVKKYKLKSNGESGYELFSTTNTKNLSSDFYHFITLIATIRTLNKQNYFK